MVRVSATFIFNYIKLNEVYTLFIAKCRQTNVSTPLPESPWTLPLQITTEIGVITLQKLKVQILTAMGRT